MLTLTLPTLTLTLTLMLTLALTLPLTLTLPKVHNPPDSCCDAGPMDDVGKFETRDVNGCFFSPLCFPSCLGWGNTHAYSESKLLQHVWANHCAPKPDPAHAACVGQTPRASVTPSLRDRMPLLVSHRCLRNRIHCAR